METENLKRIKSKLLEFNLLDCIEDLDAWINSLNDKALDNFLNLKLENRNRYEYAEPEYKAILVNLDLLKTDYYLEDVNIINNRSFLSESEYYVLYKLASDKTSLNGPSHRHDINLIDRRCAPEVRNVLVTLAGNSASLASLHHDEDMELIRDLPFDRYEIRRILDVAIKKECLESPYYRQDMELISKAKNTEYFKALIKVASNEASLNSPFHEKDMALVANAHNTEMAQMLATVATNEASLAHSIIHPEDMELINNAWHNEMAKSLTKVATCPSSLNNPDSHQADMCLIANSHDVIRYNSNKHKHLAAVATNEASLNSRYHDNDMQMIAKAPYDEYLISVAVNKASLASPYHKKDMELINDEGEEMSECLVPSDNRIKYLVKLAVNKTSLLSSNHYADMQLLKQTRDDDEYYDRYLMEVLYTLATDKASLNSPYHKGDMELLLKTFNKCYELKGNFKLQRQYAEEGNDKPWELHYQTITFLLRFLTNEESLKSPYREKDFQIITKSFFDENVDSLTQELRTGNLASLASDVDSLNSPFHEEDMQILSEVNEAGQGFDNTCTVLVHVAESPSSLNSKYHQEDMNLVSRCQNLHKKENLSQIAANTNSLNSPYHQEDMRLVYTLEGENTDDIVTELKKVACSGLNLDSPYHQKDMRLIYGVKNGAKAHYLAEVACNKHSLASSYHEKDMELIYNANETLAKYISLLACNEESLTHNHQEDIAFIQMAENEEQVKALYDMRLSQKIDKLTLLNKMIEESQNQSRKYVRS